MESDIQLISLVEKLMYISQNSENSETISHIIKRKTPYGHLAPLYILTFEPNKRIFLTIVNGLDDSIYVESYEEKPFITLVVSEINCNKLLKFAQHEDFFTARNEHGRLTSAIMQGKEKFPTPIGRLPDGL